MHFFSPVQFSRSIAIRPGSEQQAEDFRRAIESDKHQGSRAVAIESVRFGTAIE